MSRASRSEHRWLAGVLLLSLVLSATAIGWGLPTHGTRSWSYDEIPPVDRGASALDRHGGRYPPFHYDLLRVLYAPARAAAAAGWLELDDRALDTLLRLLGRSLSVLMAVGCVLLAYRIARLLLVDRRAAVLAALLAALPVPFVRFAKTVNLDVPYTFWFALSLFFLLRLMTTQRWRDYLAFAAAMALAIVTKDQAAGLFLATPIPIVAALGGELARAGARRPYLRAAFDPRPLVALAFALAIFALVHRLPWDLDGFRDHLDMIFGRGSASHLVQYDPTLAGRAAMALAALRHLAFALGWPLAAAAVAGIAVALVERRWRLLSLLLLPLAYYVAFLSPIRYLRVRWFIPIALVLTPFAALALVRLLAWPRLPRLARRAVAGGVVAWSLGLAVCLDLQMLFDARYRVEAWLEANVAPDQRWESIARHEQLTVRGREPIPWGRLERFGRSYLRPRRIDYLVANREDALRTGATRSLAALDDGSWGYEEVFRVDFDPCCGRPDWSGLSSVLVTVDPAISVYRRTERRPPSAPPTPD